MWGAQGRPVAGEATEMDTEELRLRRIQEKNRRNQRKFRARQRVSPLLHVRSVACWPTPVSWYAATDHMYGGRCGSGYFPVGA